MKQSWSLILLVMTLASCSGPLVDLSPKYELPQFVVPEDWKGSAPFNIANPSEVEIQDEWWRIFNDAVLDRLEAQAMGENPDLQVTAERFVQARYEMMKLRSGYLPKIGAGADASANKQSSNALFRGADEPIRDNSVSIHGMASWEPDIWSAIRNTTKAQVFKAQEYAAQYALAKLSLQAELAKHYFTLRVLDMQNEILSQSIDFYKKSLDIINSRFKGKIASLLDVARAQFQLANTESKQFIVQADRQTTENAIAALTNRAAGSFKIEPVDHLVIQNLKIPKVLPSTLLERRPDISSLERKMAQANKMIGVAKSAFFPNVSLRAVMGYEDNGFSLVKLINGFWSYGSLIELPVFQAGYRRAQLQQTWSVYRETMNSYRSGVLNAFREVENGLVQVEFYGKSLSKQNQAVQAALQTQDLSMKLFKGGLASSLELLYAQVNTLESRLKETEIKMSLLHSSVFLIRSLGGGWKKAKLPKDDSIQPFNTFQYTGLDQPNPSGDINVSQPEKQINLIQSTE